jgi:hypothetical protein
MAGIFDGSGLSDWGDGTIDFTPMTPEMRAAEAAQEDQAQAQAQAQAQDQRPGSSMPSQNTDNKGGGGGGGGGGGSDPEMDQYVEYLREALSQSSGWRREELQAKLDEANRDREARTRAAQIAADASKYSADAGAGASRYGADQSLAGTKYASDNSREANKYASDNSLAGTKYASDASAGASRYGSDNSLVGTKYSADASSSASRYGADQSLAGTKYQTDADLYKFGQTQENAKADQARQLLDTYAKMSENSADVFQANEYARQGRTINGMPQFINALLTQTQSSAPVSHTSDRAAAPGNQAQAVFGDSPFAGNGQAMAHLAATPGVVSPVVANDAAVATGQVRPNSVAGMRAMAGVVPQPQAIQQGAALASAAGPLYRDPLAAASPSQYMATQNALAGDYVVPAAQAYQPGQQVYAPGYSQPGQEATPAAQAYVGNPTAARMTAAGPTAYAGYGAATAAPVAQAQANRQVVEAAAQANGPRSLAQQGRLTSNAQDQAYATYKAGLQQAINNGVHTWANGSMERMSEAELGALHSAAKDMGVNPNDLDTQYQRSRIGNADPFGMA